MAGLLQEFREFAVKGNVMDLAVGVIIGGAFGKIVTSLVNDIIMPPLGAMTKGMDFTQKIIDLSGHNYQTLDEAKKAGVAYIGYGSFFTNIIDFLIIAIVVFLMVQAVNRVRRAPEPVSAAPPAPTREEELLTEIRDALLATRPVPPAA